MKCPKCSETILPKSNRCIYCGYVVTDDDRDAFIDEMIKNPQEEGLIPDFEIDYEPITVPEGSYAFGFILGLVLNIFGVIIAIATKGRRTKHAAGIGFITSSAAWIIALIVYIIVKLIMRWNEE